jgi:hypothetical protein
MVVTKLLGTLNSNSAGGCYCQCLRGKRVRRKALVKDLPMRELEPEHSSAERTVHGRVMRNVVCACPLGIWLSPMSVRRSTNSLKQQLFLPLFVCSHKLLVVWVDPAKHINKIASHSDNYLRACPDYTHRARKSKLGEIELWTTCGFFLNTCSRLLHTKPTFKPVQKLCFNENLAGGNI